jgi:hypothetical protein
VDWTSEIPTAPGFYWLLEPTRRLTVVEVFEAGAGRFWNRYAAFLDMRAGRYDWVELAPRFEAGEFEPGGLWFGPLIPPPIPSGPPALPPIR